ncbi:hypothetical protein AO262_02665 [Pseudomonas fluorescens ABAC62]|nr:hypothetical protein AO262_02665 [Pseudomonas fluorescens ABAC62]
MKTQPVDKAKACVSECLYPFKTLRIKKGYPSSEQFAVVPTTNDTRGGIKARAAFDGGTRLASVFGYAVAERGWHTLQLSPRIHLYDAWFCGLLRHSCNPNALLDIKYLELWSVRPIAAGTWLTRDYASTEDVLSRQFACQCGELNCRGWITGSQEPLNAEGQAFMAKWRMRKRA